MFRKVQSLDDLSGKQSDNDDESIDEDTFGSMQTDDLCSEDLCSDIEINLKSDTPIDSTDDNDDMISPPKSTLADESPLLSSAVDNVDKDNDNDKLDVNCRGTYVVHSSHGQNHVPRLVPFNEDPAHPRLDKRYDVCALVLFCSTHRKMALYRESKFGVFWFPFTARHSKDAATVAWVTSAQVGAHLVMTQCAPDHYQSFKPDDPNLYANKPQLLEIHRVQLPQNLNFVQRRIYLFHLRPERCCSVANRSSLITWIFVPDIADIKNQIGIADAWGVEVEQYARMVLHNTTELYQLRIFEFGIDDIYYFSPRDPPRNAEESYLLELDISERAVETIYMDYVNHCFPSFGMSRVSFCHYLNRFGLPLDDTRLPVLFVAFNFQRNEYISFSELLIGLASMDPNGPNSEVRLKLLFRFYDSGFKCFLDGKDFVRMISDVPDNQKEEFVTTLRSRGFPTTESDPRKVNFRIFLETIRKRRIAGTSKLCRMTGSLLTLISHNINGHRMRTIPTSTVSTVQFADTLGPEWRDLSRVIVNRRINGKCKTCKTRKKFNLASHGVVIDAKTSLIKSHFKVIKKKFKLALHPNLKHSIEMIFNPTAVPHKLMTAIRAFNSRKGTVERPKGLWSDEKDHHTLIKYLGQLFDKLLPILSKESTLSNVKTPAIVIGDIHGNIEDLLTIERQLWPRPKLLEMSLVFLGDYVDRGRWSMECIMYLFSLKLLQPRKVFLLRGNHEVRALQERYTFRSECRFKYGNHLGDHVWEMLNQMFDMLPVAATIDKAIFCAHGGISPAAYSLSQIRKVPRPLNDPEEQSSLAWDLLWADPCHMQQFSDFVELNDVIKGPMVCRGYVPNQKRGASYLYNEQAAIEFLERNKLHYIIRAHEVPPHGYALHFGNRCTTIFSCSHYCSHDNEAAVMIIERDRMRPVRVDTNNNSPATI